MWNCSNANIETLIYKRYLKTFCLTYWLNQSFLFAGENVPISAEPSSFLCEYLSVHSQFRLARPLPRLLPSTKWERKQVDELNEHRRSLNAWRWPSMKSHTCGTRQLSMPGNPPVNNNNLIVWRLSHAQSVLLFFTIVCLLLL